jgi:hypothetical protein
VAGKQLNFDVLAVAKATGFDDAARKVDRLSASGDKAAKSFDRQTKSAHLMSTALLSIGAAAVPVAGVAAGALIGLGAAGAVALVGILGIRDAMKQGTALGKQYQAAFKPLVAEFGLLKQIGAQGLFAGINSGVKSLKPLFPVLNRDVALFSSQIGQVAGHAGPGLVALFTRLNPLFASIGDQLVHGSKGFEQWAKSSDAVGRFVAYAQTTLPQVEQTIGSLVTTVSHVALAAEPFGGTTLTAIRLFSTAINAIPIGVLQTVVPLLLGLKVGNTLSASISNAGTGIEKFATKLGKSTGVASEASGVVGKLGKAVGFLGPVGVAAGVGMGVLSVALGHGKQAAVEQTNRINGLTAAIQNNTVAQTLLTQLQKQGAVDAAKSLGISQKQLLDSLTGSSAKFNALSAQLNKQGDEFNRLDDIKKKYLASGAQSRNLTVAEGKEYDKIQKQLPKLGDALSKEWDAYQAAKAAAADMAKQSGDNALANQIQSDSVDKVAKGLHTTSGAYIQAKLAADQNAQSTANATLQMQLENNAAGLLSQSLQQLGGNNLGLAQAQTGVASANNAAAASFKTNKDAIQGTSAAALANQQALQGAASAAIQHGQAVAQQSGSTEKATAAINADKSALEAQLRAQGQLTPAVLAYINTLYKIPPLKRTNIDANADAAAAKVRGLQTQINNIKQGKVPGVSADTATGAERIRTLQAQIDALRGKTVQITVAQQQIGLQSQRVRSATGGLIRGPGSGTSDSIPTMLSNGEYVINAAATRRHRGLLEAINGSRYATGGQVGTGPSSGGRMHITVGLTRDSDGNLQAYVRDIVHDEGQFAGATGRMA